MADYPELLIDFRDLVQSGLQKRGIDDAVAREVAGDVTEYIRQEYGGQQIYITKGQAFELSQRDLEIWGLFKHGNYVELARRFEVSERHVRRVVNAQRALQRKRTQLPLFDSRSEE